MPSKITKDEAVKWLSDNAPHICVLKWPDTPSQKTRFLDKNRGVEFCYLFKTLKAVLKKDPGRIFSATKEEIEDKKRRTNLANRNCENPSQDQLVQRKKTLTMTERYGENPFKNASILKKRAKTNLERYGVDNPSKNKAVNTKRNETFRKKYGSHPFRNREVAEKIRATNMSRYGYACVFENGNIKDKIKKTNLKKYGGHPFKNKDFMQKMSNRQKELGLMTTIDGKTLKQIAEEKGCAYSTIHQIFKRFGPDFVEEYNKNEFKTQKYITEIVESIFPELVVEREYRTPWKTDSGSEQRFDMYIPGLSLAIEYNGIQHYESIKYFGGRKRFFNQRKMDSFKRKMCLKYNISLVEIKYDAINFDDADVKVVIDHILRKKIKSTEHLKYQQGENLN